MSKYISLYNQVDGDFEVLSFNVNPVVDYVIRCKDTDGNFEWADIGTLGVSSVQGTNDMVLVNGTTGSQQIGDIILTLPQSIGTSSTPVFGGLTLGGLSGVLKATAGLISGSSTTSDLPEGSNLYFTNSRFDLRFDTDFALKSTSDLKEGSNLYFTTARARSSISGTNGISYSSSTGIAQLDSTYTPTFANIIDSGLTANTLIYSNGSKQLTSASVSTPLTFSAGALGLGYNTTNLKLTTSQLNTIQDIAVTSKPTWANVFINGSSLSEDSYLEVDNSTNGKINYLIAKKFHTGGNTLLETLYNQLVYGQDTSNNLYVGLSAYTYCNSSTAAAATTTSIWEGVSAGSQQQVFGMVGLNFYLPQLSTNSLMYTDSNKYTKSATIGSSLSFSGGSLDTAQALTTTSSPTFSNVTFSSTTASQYVKTNASKQLTTVASIPSSDITGISATAPMSYSSSTIALNYSATNLRNNGGSLDTVQNLNSSASPTFSNITASSLTASQYVKTNGSSALTTVAAIPSSDINFSVTTPITITGGSNTIGLSYNTTNLQQTSFSLNTIQDISTSSTMQLAGLNLTSSTVADSTYKLQANATAGVNSVLAVNKAGAAGAAYGFANGSSLGTGTFLRCYTTDPLLFFVNSTTEAARFDSSGNLDVRTHNIYLKASDTNAYIKYQSSFDGSEISGWQGVSFRTQSSGSQEVMRINTTSANLPLQTASTYAYIDSSKNIVSRSSANFTSDVRSQISATSPLSYNSSTGVLSTSIPSTIVGNTYVPSVVNINGLQGVLTTNGEYTRIGNVVTYGLYFTCGHNAIATSSSISFTTDLPVGNSGGWPSSYSAHGSVSCSGNTGVARISNSQQFITTTSFNLITFQVSFNVALVSDASGLIGNILVTYYVT